MAEVLGVVGSVVAVIDASAKVISKCKHIIETTRDAPRDVRHVLIEVSSLNTTLESLKCLYTGECDVPEDARTIAWVDGAVEGCRSTMEQLLAELDGLSIAQDRSHCFDPDSPNPVSKSQKLKGSLQWCLKEGKVRKLLHDAMQHKSTISLALLGEATRDIKSLKISVDSLCKDLSDANHRKVCDWIEVTNPTNDHNNAWKLHEAQTSSWIHRMEQFKKWLIGTQRFIWLNGIPGAGKTVLLSYVIEQTIDYSHGLPGKNMCLYYYCSYRQPTGQTLAFLRWVVSQLCRHLKVIPRQVMELFDKNHAPDLVHLKEALGTLLEGMGVVYILVDAVDECDTKGDLLNLLSDLIAEPAFVRVRLFATSRLHLDIDEALRPISEPVSMSNGLVDDDIRCFIEAELGTPRVSQKLSRRLVSEIRETLLSRAQGMFRWVSCQLQILLRKRSEVDIKRSLASLPSTLDETYERILLNVPRDEWPRVRTALLWICGHEELPFPTGIPLNSLLPAVFGLHDCGYAADTCGDLWDELDELCACLINLVMYYTGDGEDYPVFETVRLAHFTVREYLASDRISLGPAGYFAIKGDDPARAMIKSTLGVCSTLDLQLGSRHFFRGFPYYCREAARLAPECWEGFIVENQDVWDLYLEFLHSPKHPTSGLIWIEDAYETPWKQKFSWTTYPQSSSTAECFVAAWLITDGHRGMLSKFLQNQDVEKLLCTSIKLVLCLSSDTEPKFEGSLLEAAVIKSTYHKHSELQIILDEAAKYLNKETLFSMCVASHYHKRLDEFRYCGQYYMGMDKEKQCLLRDLVKQHKVDVSGHGHRITPLQIAAARWDLAGATMLLEYGAFPNGIGDPDGKDFSNLGQRWGSFSPLHIIRNAPFALDHVKARIPSLEWERAIDRPKIEMLLIEYGAQDLSIGASDGTTDEGFIDGVFEHPQELGESTTSNPE